jgi:predicted nuclease with TOPRIM domain
LSILTKIAVVILLVLVLIACPVFIAQATTPPNWKYAYQQETERAAAAAQRALQATYAADRAKQERDRAQRDAAMVLSRDQGTIKDLQDQLATAQRENVKTQGDLTALRADLGKLQKNYEAVEQRRQLLTKQIAQMLDDKTKLQQEVRELTAALKDATAQVQRLGKVAKVLREEIASRDETIRELSDKVEDLKKRVAKVPAKVGEEPPAPEPPVGLEGTVMAVNNDVASINIGSAKGVKPGMRLIIFRQNKFIANLRIAEVDINESVGIVSDKKQDPIQGDKVMARR